MCTAARLVGRYPTRAVSVRLPIGVTYAYAGARTARLAVVRAQHDKRAIAVCRSHDAIGRLIRLPAAGRTRGAAMLANTGLAAAPSVPAMYCVRLRAAVRFIRIGRACVRYAGAALRQTRAAFLELGERFVFQEAADRSASTRFSSRSPTSKSPVIWTRMARRSRSVCRPSKHCRHSTSGGGTMITASE